MILAICPLTHRALRHLTGRPTDDHTCTGRLDALGESWRYRGRLLKPARVYHYGCLACDRLMDWAELTDGSALHTYPMATACYVGKRRPRR